jgi:hypothetical protein
VNSEQKHVFETMAFALRNAPSLVEERYPASFISIRIGQVNPTFIWSIGISFLSAVLELTVKQIHLGNFGIGHMYRLIDTVIGDEKYYAEISLKGRRKTSKISVPCLNLNIQSPVFLSIRPRQSLTAWGPEGHQLLLLTCMVTR